MRVNPRRCGIARGRRATGGAAAGRAPGRCPGTRPPAGRCSAGGRTGRARWRGRSCTRRPSPPAHRGRPRGRGRAWPVTLAGRPLAGGERLPRGGRRRSPRPGGAAAAGRADVERRQRLYRLGELAWPDPAPDGTRPASPRDADAPAGWPTGSPPSRDEVARHRQAARTSRPPRATSSATAASRCGRPAARRSRSPWFTRPVAGMLRVGPVYTPPGLRGRGYASAATAAASLRACSRRGPRRSCCYTDLANPVSNSIYQRIGYRPVEDRVVLAFSGRLVTDR